MEEREVKTFHNNFHIYHLLCDMHFSITLLFLTWYSQQYLSNRFQLKCSNIHCGYGNSFIYSSKLTKVFYSDYYLHLNLHYNIEFRILSAKEPCRCRSYIEFMLSADCYGTLILLHFIRRLIYQYKRWFKFITLPTYLIFLWVCKFTFQLYFPIECRNQHRITYCTHKENQQSTNLTNSAHSIGYWVWLHHQVKHKVNVINWFIWLKSSN